MLLCVSQMVEKMVLLPISSHRNKKKMKIHPICPTKKKICLGF